MEGSTYQSAWRDDLISANLIDQRMVAYDGSTAFPADPPAFFATSADVPRLRISGIAVAIAGLTRLAKEPNYPVGLALARGIINLRA